jgi:hypothetical protein
MFNYMYNVRLYCLDLFGTIPKSCADKEMKQVGIDHLAVEQCYQDSFITDPDDPSKQDNRILREDRQLAQKLDIVMHPSVTINNHTYRGDMDGEDIFRALCSSFRVGQIPDECDPSYDIQLSIGHTTDFIMPFEY